MKRIILASKSPRRKELLDQIGIKYDTIVREIDEENINDLPPCELVQVLASKKAQKVAKELLANKEDALIIGADTLVVLNGKILGKPKKNLDASRMLSMLSGKRHELYTGVAVVDIKSGAEEIFTQKTKVYMKNMSEEEIKSYVLTKEPLDKAGGYGIQGKGAVFVERIEGDYFSVMGLPVNKLYDCLKNFK